MRPFKGRTGIIGKQITRSKKVGQILFFGTKIWAYGSPYGKNPPWRASLKGRAQS